MYSGSIFAITGPPSGTISEQKSQVNQKQVPGKEISPISITDAMKRVVPTFRDPESVNSEAESAKEMKLAEK